MAVSFFIFIFAPDNSRCIYVLKHMEALNKLPWAAKSPIFKKVSEISDISSLSKEERIKYDHAIKVYRDSLCTYEYAIETGVRKGREEGLRKGMEKGREEGERIKALSIAKEMKKLNMDISIIIKTTGLTADDINNV